jgi:hypothetical protein
MSKSFFGWTATGVFAAAFLTFGGAPSAAFSPSPALGTITFDSHTVLVAQQQQRGKGKGKQAKKSKISPEHQERIRQHVPQEYHQYIPGMSTGGGGAGR